MPHLDDDDLQMIMKAVEAVEERKHREDHPEDFNADGTPKVHTKSVKRRVTSVTIVIVCLAVADHFIHLEFIFRTAELFGCAFFDWWFNVANAGEMKMPKVPLPKMRRKTK